MNKIIALFSIAYLCLGCVKVDDPSTESAENSISIPETTLNLPVSNWRQTDATIGKISPRIDGVLLFQPQPAPQEALHELVLPAGSTITALNVHYNRQTIAGGAFHLRLISRHVTAQPDSTQHFLFNTTDTDAQWHTANLAAGAPLVTTADRNYWISVQAGGFSQCPDFTTTCPNGYPGPTIDNVQIVYSPL